MTTGGDKANGKSLSRRNSKGEIRRATIRQIRMSIHAEHLLLMEKEQDQLSRLGAKARGVDAGEESPFLPSPRSVTTTQIQLPKEKDTPGGGSGGGGAGEAGLSLSLLEYIQTGPKTDVVLSPTSATHSSDLSRLSQGREKSKRRKTAMFGRLPWKNPGTKYQELPLGDPPNADSLRECFLFR